MTRKKLVLDPFGGINAGTSNQDWLGRAFLACMRENYSHYAVLLQDSWRLFYLDGKDNKTHTKYLFFPADIVDCAVVWSEVWLICEVISDTTLWASPAALLCAAILFFCLWIYFRLSVRYDASDTVQRLSPLSLCTLTLLLCVTRAKAGVNHSAL